MSGRPPELISKGVRAGAGAGKTTNLVQEVLATADLFRQQGIWPRMVVTTFTRKATQELRSRLIVEACSRQDLALLDYCRSSAQLHISTIHGVLGLFLRRYGQLAGLDPAFSLLDDQASQLLRKKVLRKILAESQDSQLDSFSTEEILQISGEWIEIWSIDPGATAARADLLLAEQQRRRQKLATRAMEFSQMIRLATRDGKWVEYADFLLRLSAGLEKGADSGEFAKLRAVIEDWPRKPATRKGESLLGLQLDSEVDLWAKDTKRELASAALDPEKNHWWAGQSAALAKLAAQLREDLRVTKTQKASLDLADLELWTAEILQDHPGLAGAFASDWDYWLIDEFQDTSPLQVQILEKLIRDRSSYVVGDPQQSIYLFRGADVSVFDRRLQKIEDSKGRLLELTRNYRSRPSLLRFMNDFFTGLSPQFRTMQARDGELDEDHLNNSATVIVPEVTFLRATDRSVEYSSIEAYIWNLKNQGVNFSDICILARTNRTLFNMAKFLKERGIPTHVHASGGFHRRREVRDALALLKFLAHPHDNRNLVELLRSPWCRIDDEKLAEALRVPEALGVPGARDSRSHWQLILQSEIKDHEVICELEKLRARSNAMGVGQAWLEGLLDFGFFDFSHHHDPTGRREANLWKLVALYFENEREPGFRVLDFARVGQGIEKSEEESSDGDAVTALEPNVVNLMTVHASKGLQRKHVIIPHADEEVRLRDDRRLAKAGAGQWVVSIRNPADSSLVKTLFHDRQSRTQRERLMEEFDRLLYVAVTRAEETLLLSWSGEVSPKSWAGRWRWDTSTLGLHKKSDYRYLVTQLINSSGAETGQGQLAPNVRSRWCDQGKMAILSEARTRQGEKAPSFIHRSVTAMLEDPRQDFCGKVFRSGSSWKEPAKKSSEGPREEPREEPREKSAPFERGEFLRPKKTILAPELEKVLLGTQFHLFFERMRFQSIEEISESSHFCSMKTAQRDKLIEAMNYISKLSSPPMKRLLKEGYVEWGFQCRFDNLVLDGQIDIWGVVDGVLWIVDYKTGSVDHVEKACRQLQIYLQALRKFGHQEPAKMAVIFPLDKVTRMIGEL